MPMACWGWSAQLRSTSGSTTPIYVQAVLLPFEGQIIYDSLLVPYRVYFGPGIRGYLNDTYRNIQEREGIITTLEPSDVPANLNEVRNEVLARNAKILGAFRKDSFDTDLSVYEVPDFSSGDTYRNHKEPGGSSPSGSSSCMPMS